MKGWVLLGLVLILAVSLLGCADVPEEVDPDLPEEVDPDLDGEIVIGCLTSLSGPFTPWGFNVRDGMTFAANEINDAGGVLGMEVVILERDTKGDPSEAMTALEELVDVHDVVAVGGLISSGVGVATSALAEDLQVPHFLTMCAINYPSDYRYTFRTSDPPAPVQMAPLADYIQQEGITRVGVIVADYEWGHNTMYAVEQDIMTLPDVSVAIEVTPVTEVDFAPYLRRIDEAVNPEILVLTGHPPGSIVAAKQAIELGIGDLIFDGWQPPELWVEGLGAERAAENVIIFATVDFEHPGYLELAARFAAETGSFLDNSAFSAYAIVKMVAQAVEQTGSLDRVLIADYIRETVFDFPGYGYPLSFTEWGELAEARLLIQSFELADPGPINPGADWTPGIIYTSDPLAPFVLEEWQERISN